MPDPETLTQLVSEHVGHGTITYRVFEDRAIDPETGYRPSKSTLWKVARGEPVKISPQIVRAIAAGLGLRLARVAAAAAYQYTGLIASPAGTGTAIHAPGASTARAEEIVAGWEEEEGEGEGSPPGRS